MAKIRVYELAKELNLSNKVLLSKLKKVDISVKSHMSSLDDESVTQVKDFIFGKADSDLDEKRVKPSVIRRRKKQATDTTPEVEEDVPVAVESESKDVTVKPELQGDTSSRKDAQEPVKPEVQAPVKPEVQEPVKPKNIAKKSKPAKIVASARIVTPAKVIEPEKEADKQTEPDTQKEPDTAVVKEPVSEPVNEKDSKIVESKDQKSSVEGSETLSVKKNIVEPKTVNPESSSSNDNVRAEVPTVSPEIDAANPAKPISVSVPETDSETIAPKLAKKKKQKKSNAAKIIKLPSMIPPVKPKAARPASTGNPAKKTYTPKRDNAPVSVGTEKKGKDVKKKVWANEDTGPAKKFVKKKSSFRKKSVVEGKALYGKGRFNKGGRKGGKAKGGPAAQKTLITTPKAIKRRIKVDDAIILAELAKRMGIKANEMIQKLMGMGVMATVNQTIDYETAALVATEFGYEVERAAFEEEVLFVRDDDTPEQLIERPPVVTIMGHVDHGKTSLLDVIRTSRVTDAEAGGITQHIGAYLVTTPGGQIAFLDTPGHEAFTAMRSRGARVTDIVILVVAADDGVMPQTIEAINHSKAAEVPIIVAINKMDKPDADPDRVKRELSEYGVVAEEWGGTAIFVHVSAKENTGVDELLEMVLLQSEVQELKANPNKLAKGHVVEAKLDSGRGPVATILVQEGTLKTGDSVVCGLHFGKIRAMVDDKNKPVVLAGPSMPVEIIGLSGVPEAGDELVALADEKDAKQVSAHRSQKQRATELARSSRLNLEGLFAQMEMGEVKDLNLILKADVHGSIEALKDSLVKLTTSKVKVNIVHSATGTVSESDVSLATVSNAIILGFNVRPGAKVHDFAKEEMVDMRFYDVIYDAIKDVKNAMVGLMDSTFKEVVIGRAEVRDTFVIPKVGTIAGAYVTDGKIQRGQSVRLLRDGVIKCDGKLSSLKRFKDDAKEVQHGYECGLGIENYNDIKVEDTIECYFLEEIKPTLDDG